MPANLRRTLAAAAVVAGVAAGAVVARGVAPLEPSLAIRTTGTPMAGGASIHEVFVEVRGGETLDRVTIESASDGVRVLDPRTLAPVPPEQGIRFRVLVDPGAPRPRRVRVVQEGRVSRTWDVPLSGDGR